MDPARKAALRKVILIGDGVLVCLSMAIAYWVHDELRNYTGVLRPRPPASEYALVAYSALPIWLALTAQSGVHRIMERLWTRTQLLRALLKVHGGGVVALALVLLLTQGVVNRSLVGFFVISSFVLMYAERALLTRWLRYQFGRGHGRPRILLVGTMGRSMAAFVRASIQDPLAPDIVGRLDASELGDRGSLPPPPDADQKPVGELAPRLGTMDTLDSVLHEHPVDEVFFFPPFHDPRLAHEALEVCTRVGVPASFSVDFSAVHEAVPRVVQQMDCSFITYELAPKPALGLAIKHATDAVAAAVGLVLLSPLMLTVALAIWATMKRPIFFVQRRAGLHGKPFRMLKFRTMVRDAEAQQSALENDHGNHGEPFKMEADPRVTPLGRFLRRSSIDELPQLINVLLGTMSLVGPRPLPVHEQQRIHGWHRRRLSMKPGITCLWQVSGRSNVDFEQWMRLDLRYVDTWSLWLDCLILWRTIPAVLSSRGAH